MVVQGELWLMETPNQKQRPVLVVSRDDVIAVLNNIVIAPVTSTIRLLSTSLDRRSRHGSCCRSREI